MSTVQTARPMMSRVIFTGAGHYQLYWQSRGYELSYGQASPPLPLHECMRLMKTGMFTGDDGTWESLISRQGRKQAGGIEGMLKGQRCFIIGGGPSLRGFDLHRLDDEFTIAVNHSYEYYPNARALLFVDSWFVKDEQSRSKILAYPGLIFASFRCQDRLPRGMENLYIFSQNNREPGKRMNDGLYSGRLSGLAALNLATIMGADEIYLLGFDMNYQDGQHHWYGTAHENQETYDAGNYTRKLKMFDAFAPYQDRIFNCSMNSAITTFNKVPIEDVLKVRRPIQVKEAPRSMLTRRSGSSRTPEYPASPPQKLARINGMLKGKRVFVVASGPSLIGFDFKRLSNEETIAVNHTLEHFPAARHHLFGDPRVLNYVRTIYKDYAGNIFASHHANLGSWERNDERVYVFAKRSNSVGEKLEDGLYSDFNSGMEAVNLALVMGAEKIYLLGMDFCAHDGKYYFYGKPAWMKAQVTQCDSLLEKRNIHWSKFEPYKDRIYNCSKISRITTFQRADIDEVLNDHTN